MAIYGTQLRYWHGTRFRYTLQKFFFSRETKAEGQLRRDRARDPSRDRYAAAAHHHEPGQGEGGEAMGDDPWWREVERERIKVDTGV